MKTEAGNRLGTEKIGKLMLELALPSVLAQIVNVLYNIVDRIYIGRIPGVGAAALTGVGVTFSDYYDYFCICRIYQWRRRAAGSNCTWTGK